MCRGAGVPATETHPRTHTPCDNRSPITYITAIAPSANGFSFDARMWLIKVTKPIPLRTPPPHPCRTPWGRWYVAGYETDGREHLTYQPHTHTPFTKPQVRRTHSNPGTPAKLDWSPQLIENEREPRNGETSNRFDFGGV